MAAFSASRFARSGDDAITDSTRNCGSVMSVSDRSSTRPAIARARTPDVSSEPTSLGYRTIVAREPGPWRALRQDENSNVELALDDADVLELELPVSDVVVVLMPQNESRC